MSAARTSRPRRLLTVGSSALFVILGSLLFAQPAAAHDELLETDPAPDSSVAEMPEELTLSFSGALITLGGDETIVEVASPSGVDATDGAPTVEGAVVRQPLGPVDEAGLYTVTWKVVSSDGHPTSGTYTFTVENPTSDDSGAVPPANDETTTAQPSKRPVTTPTLDPSTSSEAATTPATSPGAAGDADGGSTSFGEVLPWLLLGAAGVAVLGGAVALLVSRARGGADRDGGSPTP